MHAANTNQGVESTFTGIGANNAVVSVAAGECIQHHFSSSSFYSSF